MSLILLRLDFYDTRQQYEDVLANEHISDCGKPNPSQEGYFHRINPLAEWVAPATVP